MHNTASSFCFKIRRSVTLFGSNKVDLTKMETEDPEGFAELMGAAKKMVQVDVGQAVSIGHHELVVINVSFDPL